MATAAVKYFILTVLCASVAMAGRISVTSNATLTAANSNAVGGDTVAIAAGTYTVPIAPANAGSAGSPIVYMPTTSSAVCSLYIAGGYGIEISTDYVIVQGIAVKMDPTSAYHPVYVHGCEHSAIIDCRTYGGSTQNTYTRGDWNTWRLNDIRYCRIIGNAVDRLDAGISDDDYRGDGIALTGANSHYNIIEGNYIKNVSHFAIAVPVYTSDGAFNIVRNNVAHDCHGLFGTSDGARHTLWEGNIGWNPGMIDTYQSGPAMEMFGDSTIVRYNKLAHDTTVTPVGAQSVSGWGKFVEAGTELIIQGSTAPYDAEQNGRYYGNAFTAQVTYPAGYSDDRYKFALTILDAGVSGFGYSFGKSVLKNNIIAFSTDTMLVYYQNGNTSYTTMADTFAGNAFWNGTPGEKILTASTADHTGTYTLSEAKSTFPLFQSSNINVSPLWVDSTSNGAARSYEISGTSHCKDAGVALTVTASSASAGQKVISVGDATYFHYDWGASPYDRGDSLLVGSERIELDSVDYVNNRLIAKSNLANTIPAGSSVHVLATWSTQNSAYTNRLSGSAPDIGPYEIQQGSGGVVVPGQTTNASPADGSTQAQPVMFRWRAVSGATSYWLTASYDNWAHDHVSVQIPDTFYTYSGFPVDTAVIWNVAAGNSAGWGSWSTTWAFRTQAEVTYSDTLTVDWNNVVKSATLADNTVIEMVNLQRVENRVIIRNPAGKLLQWPAGVTWLGLTAPPQPATGDTSVYLLIRDGSSILGFDLSKQTGSGGGVSAGWVISQLANYLRKDADAILSGDQVYRKIGLTETSSSDTVWIEDDGGQLRLTDYNGSYLLSELVGGGGGGVADGQNADSLQGKPLSPYRPPGKSAVIHDPDSSGYRHLGLMSLDSNGVGNGDGKKLTIVGGQIVARNDSVGTGGGVTDHGALTGLSDNDHPQYALRADTTTWLMTKTRLDLMLAGYLPLTGGALSGSLNITGAATSTTYMQTNQDTVGTSGTAGNRYTWWTNSQAKFQIGLSTTGTALIRRTLYDGQVRNVLYWTKSATAPYWQGLHEIDSLNILMDYIRVQGYPVAWYTGTPSVGQTLKWVGGNWAVANDSVGTGGSGAADGQNADSLQGKPLSPYRPAGKTAVAYDPDSTGYRHIPLIAADTANFWPGKAGVIDTVNGALVLKLEELEPTDYVRNNADMWTSNQHGQNCTAPATQAMVASTIKAHPYIVTKSYAIDSVKLEVSTGVAGSRHAIGIYEDTNGDLYPDSLRLSLGAYTAAAAAVKSDTVTAPLGSTSPGSFRFKANTLYFISIQSSGTATFRAVPLAAIPNILGYNPAMGTNSQYTGWNVTGQTYTYPNSLPTVFPAGGTLITSNLPPLLVWRVKP